MASNLFADLIPQAAPDFGEAISGIESGGRYDALGPQTKTGDRAYGKYQVMGANIPSWTRETLGREMTPQEFLSNPQAQDAVFKTKFGSYVQKYGPEGAAKAWFAGEKGMNNPNAQDVLGTTVQQYGQKFTKALGSAPKAPQGLFDDLIPRQGTAPIVPVERGPDLPAPINQTDMGGYSPEQVPQAATHDIGWTEAALRGAKTGITANFGDELEGVLAAGAAANPVARVVNQIPGVRYLGAPVTAGIGMGQMLSDWYNGKDPKAAQEYERAKNEERIRLDEARQQYPGTTLAGEAAGAVALPGGTLIRGASLPVRAATSAGVGAGYGALAGAGEGDTPNERLSRAGSGAAVGGAVGAAAPVVLRGAEAVVGAAAAPLKALRGARDPETEAARRILAARERDVKAGDAGLTDAEFAAAKADGVPVALVDQGGSTTRALERSAANISAEGRAALEKVTSDRFSGQGDRVADALTDLVRTPGNAGKTREMLEDAAQKARKPFYDRAYARGRVGIVDNELLNLAQIPAMQDAIKAAITQAENRVGSGRAGAMLSPDGKPTLEFWDLVQRQLRQKVDIAKRNGAKEDAMEFGGILEKLLNKLDAAVPEFSAARGVAASFFKADDALSAGEKFVTEKYAMDGARQAWAKMTSEERELFKEGFISRYAEMLRAGADRQNTLNKIGQSVDARQRLRLVLGNDTDKVDAFLRVEGVMDRARTALGNSTTARQLYELAAAGATNPVALGTAAAGAQGFATGNMGPGDAVTGILVGLARRGQIRIDERIARRVGEMLASNDPKILQKGLQAVSRNNSMRDALRQVDEMIARTAGQQGTGVSGVQTGAISRAEDDRKDVPRPPGQ